MEAASAASAVVEQQSQQKQTTSQKSKKKSKNKKTTVKNCAHSASPADELNHSNTNVNNAKYDQQGGEVSAGTIPVSTAANGLCVKMEQQLHIAADNVDDSHQLNGTAEKYCAHATLNGHHSPAVVIAAVAPIDKSNGTCESAVQTQEQKKSQSQSQSQSRSQLQQNTLMDGDGNGNNNGKKSKSKNNKKHSKEAARQNTLKGASNNGDAYSAVDGELHCLNAASTIATFASKELQQEEEVAVQLENGFSHKNNVNTNTKNGAMRSNDDGNSQAKVLQHEACHESTVAEVELVPHPVENEAKAIGLASTSATVTTMAPSNCNRSQSLTQLPAAVTIIAAHNINANLTATENSNTAKPNDAANVVANANAKATAATAEATTATATAKLPAETMTAAAITTATATGTETKTNTDTTSVVAPVNAPAPALDLSNVHIEYKEYESELQMHDIMRLIQAELSEPYSIYTYRYFIYNWPKLCFLAAHGNEYVGAIVCKLDMHMNVRRGYIAMLAVRKEYRKLKIGTTLVQKAIEAMLADNADEVVLETEMRNVPALRLYENLGFVRDKRLFRYYLNGVDALRLKLWFR